MRDYEKYYAETYKKIQDVSPKECVMSRNCGTCMYCRNYTGKWEELENSYCMVVKREPDRGVYQEQH